MSHDIAIGALVSAPAAFAGAMYAIKRLSAFDLELRNHRELVRARYLRTQRVTASLRVDEVGDTAARAVAHLARPPVQPSALHVHTSAGAGATPSPDDASVKEAKTFRPDNAVPAAPISDDHWVLRASTHGRGYGSPIPLTRSRGGLLAEPAPASLRAIPEPPPPPPEVPRWVMRLLDPAEADRCAREWRAHLHERIVDGELREARIDQRRLALHALALALKGRARRFFRAPQ